MYDGLLTIILSRFVKQDSDSSSDDSSVEMDMQHTEPPTRENVELPCAVPAQSCVGRTDDVESIENSEAEENLLKSEVVDNGQPH